MMIKDIPFETGSLDTMIDRLYKIMGSMDEQWSKKVEPASEEQIHMLRKISGLEEKGKNIPRAYLLYLKAMGKNDNGLLEQEWDGHSKVDIGNVLKYYNSYTYDIDKNEYMPFLTHWTDAGLYLKLTDGENPSIRYFDLRDDRTLYAGSFEKYLFQMAFLKVINTRFSYQIHLSASWLQFQDILSKGTEQGIQWADHMEFMERILEPYRLQRAWFSDAVGFYGISPECIVSANLMWGLNMTISGDSRVVLQDMKKSLDSLFGDLVHWKVKNDSPLEL